MFARHKLTKNGNDFIVLLDQITRSKRTTQKKLTPQLQNQNIHYVRVDTVFYTMPISVGLRILRFRENSFLVITFKILIEHIEPKSSSDSKLQIDSLCSVGVLSILEVIV